MARRKAFLNCSIYLGRGSLIDKGYVVFCGPRIEEVGSAGDFTRSASTEVTDLEGKLVLPGLTDAHLHLVGYAKSLVEPDLSATHSLEEGLELLRGYLADLAEGAWLTGRGWDKQRWSMADFPTREMLDTVAPSNPVALTSRDGHLVWINSAGLYELGLAENAVRVEGGEIVVDAVGRPTGIFKENAAVLVWDRLGGRDEERVIGAIMQASAKLAGMGLTRIHTLEGRTNGPVLHKALQRRRLDVDVVRIREVHEPGELKGLRPSPGAHLVKTYADGTLGSQTASMLDPYCGEDGNLGIPALDKAKLGAIVFGALGRGFGVCVHAIGDRANLEVLDVYEAARREAAWGGNVLRIEHVQVLRSADIPRFARLKVIASMQPIHLVSDRHVAEKYWGARSATAYAWKRILRSGGVVAFGSDAPIESPDPLRGIHAAVARCDPGKLEEGPWFPEERLEAWQAVDCYTLGSAAASGGPASPEGEPPITGLLTAGSRADFTILDRDILAPADPRTILEARVVGTVISGEPRFQA